jgi:spermidine synthase
MPKYTEGYQFTQQATPGVMVSRAIGRLEVLTKTAFQECAIWQSEALGTCVTIDGDLQSTAMDCATYHEALVHPAMLVHPNPRSVLICGGGEGATARECLRYAGAEKVVMVDIDGEFVELCKEHLPTWHAGAFGDARLTVLYEDIFAFIERNRDRFDVVIGDLTDLLEEIAPGKSFHSPAFYRSLKALMNPGGILATQASALALFDAQTHKTIKANIASVFAQARSYRASHDSFLVPWSFVLASDQALPSLADLPAAFSRGMASRQLELTHFDAPSLAACFCLNRRIKALIDENAT